MSKNFMCHTSASYLIALAVAVPVASSFAEDPNHLSTVAALNKNAVHQFDSVAKLQKRNNLLSSLNMTLTDIEIYKLSNGQSRFIGVWGEQENQNLFEVYTSQYDFDQDKIAKQNLGFRVEDIERLTENNSTTYYVVYKPSNISQNTQSGYFSSFESAWISESQAGMRIVDLDVDTQLGSDSYIGTFEPGNDGHYFYSISSESIFFQKHSEFTNNGTYLSDVNLSINSNGSRQYIGVWRAGNFDNPIKVSSSWDDFKTDWATKSQAGYKLISFDIAPGNGSNSYQEFIASYIPANNNLALAIDVENMAWFLEDTFDTTVNGMAYAISQNGQLAAAGATGFAQRTPDPNIAMTSEARSTIASVTKLLTAPLVYKLLDENNLTIDSPIAPWLPSNWNRGTGFGAAGTTDLTFRDLLSHHSGIRQTFNLYINGTDLESQWGTNWDRLQFVVGYGASPGSSYAYDNINYALMRVMIPALWAAQGGPSLPVTKTNVAQRYLDYMQLLIADDEDILSIACTAQAGYTESRMYKFNDFSVSGWSFVGDPDDCGGHAVLNLSAQDMTKYWTAVRYNDDIMSPSDRATMINDRAGAAVVRSLGGGQYAYGHDGGWYWDGDGTGLRTTETCLLEFPNNIIASIILNSDHPGTPQVCTALSLSYRESVVSCDTSDNLVSNCNFDSNNGANWSVLNHQGGSGWASFNQEEMAININYGSNVDWHVQARTPISVNNAGTYQLSFDARATSARSLKVFLGHNGNNDGNWTAYGETVVNLNASMQTYTLTFSSVPYDLNAVLDFNAGNQGNVNVVLDNISLKRLP